MAGAQRKYPGRVWASAAVPLLDTRIAIEVLDDAVNRLGLMGVNLPGSVGSDPRIDAERLEPFYARCEKLGLPLFLHPTDVIFQDMLDGYDGAFYLRLGRVIEVSVAAMRLILSGTAGASSQPENRDVAHRRHAAVSGRPPRQEWQGGEAAAAGDRLHQADVHRHGLAAHRRHQVRDRLLRHRSRDVRQRLSVLGPGAVPEADRRDRPFGRRPAEAVQRQRAAESSASKTPHQRRSRRSASRRWFKQHAASFRHHGRARPAIQILLLRNTWMPGTSTVSVQTRRRSLPICHSRRASCRPRSPCRRGGGQIFPSSCRRARPRLPWPHA